MRPIAIFAAALCLSATVIAYPQSHDLESSYLFLIGDRESHDGVLYKATAGGLRGMRLPLSYVDSPQYWGDYVCQHNACAVIDVYNPFTYTLTPQQNAAGKLQAERINVHSGTNIYDAATWQIAIMLGHTINSFRITDRQDAYTLATSQNKLLQLGYSGDAITPVRDANRAISNGDHFDHFVYNNHVVSAGEQAYAFRAISRSWISTDPLMNTRHQSLITMTELPTDAPPYQRGNVTWTDWKPITGENAWAFLIGPLQAATIHFVKGKHRQYIPFDDLSIQNALAILPTFAAMQSPIGGVYYVPSGTIGNQGDQLVNSHQVSVENNASLYAGLRILQSALRAELDHEKDLADADRAKINAALDTISVMIEGGQISQANATEGLLNFFHHHAWRDNEFVQGGLANDPGHDAWTATTQPRAIDANTWAIAALGVKKIDEWFGAGAAFRSWQQIKSWGAYGVNNKLWGVGFSDEDGNGINKDGTYKQGILSAEWTAGAINMVRSMIHYYEHPSASSVGDVDLQGYVNSLKQDETAMLEGLQTLRIDHYIAANFPGKPDSYGSLIHQSSKPYVYASKRYFIPFGWYANPLPSTCATSWVIMLAHRYDPFGYAGQPN